MKTALADRPAIPFRVPPGIKLVRINPKSGLRAGPGENAILEAFKPGTAPPDSYSVIGSSDASMGVTPEADRAVRSERAGSTDLQRRCRSGAAFPPSPRVYRRAPPRYFRGLSSKNGFVMRAELAAKVEEINGSVDLLRQHLNVDRSRRRLAELNAIARIPTSGTIRSGRRR